MVQEYCRGDIFFITEGTYTGSEQSGGRPGVIVSNDLGNKHSPNVEVVFLTSREKKPMPTHVEVLCKVPSTALCENIQTVSKERLDTFIRSCTTSEMKNIDHALLCSLGLHNHKCARYYNREQDGLSHDWGGGTSILQSPIRKRNRKMGSKIF